MITRLLLHIITFLAGRKVDHATKGLYIGKGQKILIK